MKKLTKKQNELDKLKGSSSYSIKNDFFDLQFFKKALNNALRTMQKTGSVQYPPFSELMADTFFSLFKNHPELASEFEMNQDFLLNRDVIEMLMDNYKWKDLRTHTKLDIISATIGTQALAEELMQHVDELKKQQEQLQAAMTALEEAEESEGSEEEKAVPKDSGITLEEAKQKLEEARANFRKDLKASPISKDISKVLTRVHDTVTESVDAIHNWGLSDDITFQQTGYQEKLDLIERLRKSEKLKKIADLAGRFKRIALAAQREKVKKGIDEIYSIHQGRDFGRMIPSQYIYLTEEHLELLLYKAYTEGQILQYQLSGKERKRKGPIITCLDSSGSMGGMAEIWSKAVALALFEVARSQKRDFAAIHFSGNSNPQNLKVHEFLRNEPFQASKLIDMAQYFENGGTLFEPPLQRSQIFMDKDNDWHKASIIFITDGESVVGDNFLKKFLEWRDKHKVKIISVIIDTWANNLSSVKEFSQEVYRLSDLRVDNGQDLALNIFRDVL
jgi:uncharacterized protein with von Willebrand factor type A (vWA) domain